MIRARGISALGSQFPMQFLQGDLHRRAGKWSRMFYTTILTIISILALPLTTAVTVTLTNGIGTPGPIQTCHNLPPGQCCRSFPVASNNYFNPFNPGAADFYHLLPMDVAAVWARRGNIRDCSGIPIETRAGPGRWHFESTGDGRAFGASYVRLPSALPPGETEANWLSAEGMLGLVWGGGKWFAKGVEIAGMSGAIGSKRKRGVVSEEKGTAYIRGPRRWKWPDEVVVNGTRYVAEGLDGSLYHSADGKVLNRTDFH
ncbi:MAG: hypothetical protein L6R38_003251 [Xanthoria sp. 2 TBL-2021]|nr:MAG: hypothetical protein L6R38_003251 [Xanthoria sp. 2 TBL-2021]